MTKEETLYQFFAGFNLPAFEENTVINGFANYPYLTYNVITDAFDGNEVMLHLSLWYRSTSWEVINAKAEQISTYIGAGGKVLQCDGGAIWVKRGRPFSQSMGDASDNMIRRKYINITVEFLTTD